MAFESAAEQETVPHSKSPLPVQSAAFTLPWTDGLFWLIASTAIPAGFGVGFIGGVLGGSFVSAALRGELQLQSFSTAPETLRYVAGGGLMGQEIETTHFSPGDFSWGAGGSPVVQNMLAAVLWMGWQKGLLGSLQGLSQ